MRTTKAKRSSRIVDDAMKNLQSLVRKVRRGVPKAPPLILAAVFLFGVTLPCLAQQATIVGTVTDPTGSVIPGARITVSNLPKGFVLSVTTNSAGGYVAANVPIGDYVITAEVPGFQRFVRTGVPVHVAETLREDVQLKVGSVSQTVSVKGNALHVQTDTAAISTVVTGEQISNLELNGRNYLALTLLVPGVSPANDLQISNPSFSGLAISSNGGSGRMNEIYIDGNPDVDEGCDCDADTNVSLDSIAEFRMATSGYGAATGHVASAQIEISTKSGTKRFHGDAYEYLRNDALDANPFFQNRVINPPGGSAPKTPLHRNDFGFTLGGPVYIPGHYNTDKSRTFFFWSEEWHRYNQSQVINAPVPSLLMREGDFSQCAPASASYNPVVASGCALPSLNGATYDTVQQVPGFGPQAFTNATDLLNAYIPLPNSGPIGFVTSAPTNTDWRQDMLRLDEHFTDRTTAYAHLIQDAANTLQATAYYGSNTYDTVQSPYYHPGYNLVAHLTRVFSSSLFNDVQLGFFMNRDKQTAVPGPVSVSHSIDRPSDFVMNHLYPANDSNPQLPGISMGGGVPFSFFQDPWTEPRVDASPSYDLVDSATKVIGRHMLKFGFYLEKYEKNETFDTNGSAAGDLFFYASGSLTTGNALADMLLGRIPDYQEVTVTRNGVPLGGYGRGYWRLTDFEPYFEDDWRVNSRLTLNLGVRYYYFVPQHDIQNPPVDSDFLPSLYNPAQAAQLDANGDLIPGSGSNYTMYGNGLVGCGRNGIPEGCTHISEANVAPRFGFAYDPFGRGTTAIRGGYGIDYSDSSESMAEGLGGNPPVGLTTSGYNILGYDKIVPGTLGPFTGMLAIPLHQKMPSVQQYSLSIQHMFSHNDLLSLAYVGDQGRHLTRQLNMNQLHDGVGVLSAPALAGMSPYCDAQGNCDVQPLLINQIVPDTFFVPFRGYGPTILENPFSAISSYNSLQMSFRHAFSHGLTFQASYTWSHEIDTSSDDSFLSNVDDSDLRRWRGTGDINRTQMLTMNYIYNLPFFAHSNSRLARGAVGGWRLSGISTFYTGTPINVGFNCGVNGFSTGIGEGVTCNTVGPVKIKKGVFDDPQYGPTVTWFDPNVLTQPLKSQLAASGERGMFGYAGRNVLTGPGRNNWDLALLKDFKLPWLGGESSTLQFRVETFNTFNHTQWNSVGFGCSGAPNNDGSPAFGRPCGGALYNLGNGEVNGTWDPRIVQLAAKLTF